MCHDLQPIISRSEVLHHDVKGLQIGLSVLFLDLIPITNGFEVMEYGSKGLKNGKKVMCYDLQPTNGRSEVMKHHHEPANSRSEVTDDDFRSVVTDDGIHAWHFRCVPSVRQGLCCAETPYAETARAVSKIKLLTIKCLLKWKQKN